MLEKGKLTPRVLEVFEAAGSEAVMRRVAELGVKKWIPPLLPTTRNGPLGYSRPSWE